MQLTSIRWWPPSLLSLGFILIFLLNPAMPDSVYSQDETFFRRGDVNADGVHSLADGVDLLHSLFLPGRSRPSCLDAGDADDDGRLDTTDALRIFQVTVSCTGLPTPFLVCGADPTLDSLGCEFYAPCAADVSVLVCVGDSLTAGFHNGSLYQNGQERSFASQVAQQAGTTLPLPLIQYPGVPQVLELLDPGPPPIVVPSELRPPAEPRIDPSLQAFNLAVPGHNVADALILRPELPVNSFTDLILGLPGLFAGVARSQIEWVEALSPTTIFVWLGSNDVLCAVTSGETACLTDPAAFHSSYIEVMDRLQVTGATLLVANIPDVSVIPYVYSAEEVAGIIGQPLKLIGPVLGIREGDAILYPAWAEIPAILLDLAQGPLADDLVLSCVELEEIRTATDAFNEIIAVECAARGGALVDVHALTTELDEEGFSICDIQLTTEALGGLFSLDGIHPTYTGQAIIANAFIQRLNSHFSTQIPEIVVRDIAATDPLVLVPVPVCP